MSDSAKPLRQVLEDALAADPDDLAAHAAYADLLVEEGDPRGDYIRAQLALEDSGLPVPERRRLDDLVHYLSGQYKQQWLGGLAPFLVIPARRELHYDAPGEYTLRRGWIDTLEIDHLTVPFAEAVARSPLLRLLRKLTIVSTTHVSRGEPAGRVTGVHRLEPLRRAEHLGNVRRFQLGNPQEWQAQADGTGVIDVIRRMPRLEELCVIARPIDSEALFALELPRLRGLRVGLADRWPLEVLAANESFAGLTHLLLDGQPAVGVPTEEPPPTPEGVRALARSPHLAGVTHLRLRIPNLGDAACEALIDAGMLARLQVLDLSGAGLTDAAARRLAACPDLRRLAKLNLSFNWLTPDGIAALEVVGDILNAENQYDAPLAEAGEDEIPF